MLVKLTIELQKDKKQFFKHDISYFFQGVIMENISYEYAEEMHISSIRPYSQFVQLYEDKILWVVTAINKRAYENIILPLMETSFNEVYIKNEDIRFKILSKKIESLDVDSFVEDKLFGEEERYVKLKFISPCSFKSQGEYIFYPTVKNIFHNLISKFESAGYKFSIYTPELLSDFENHISIVQYNLKSRIFHLKGVKIPSFMGEVTFKITGPKNLVNLANMLLYFGKYSGVGIKSAIGMGAIDIEKRN